MRLSSPLGGRLPPATLWTILIIAGLFVAYAFADAPAWGQNLAVSDATLRKGYLWVMFSAVVWHLDARDLIYNGIGLWAFGAPLERSWGSARFLRFIVTVGVVANLVTAVASVLGMSGAVAGLGPAVVALVFAWTRAIGELRVRIIGGVLPARHLGYFVIGLAVLGSLMAGRALETVHILSGLAFVWFSQRSSGLPTSGSWLNRLHRIHRRRFRLIPGGRKTNGDARLNRSGGDLPVPPR